MISFKSLRLRFLLVATAVVLQAMTAYGTSGKPSRKIKRVDQQTFQQIPSVQAGTVASQVVLPEPVVLNPQAAAILPSAVTPLLAIALMQLLTLQSDPEAIPTAPAALAFTETFGEPCPNSEKIPDAPVVQDNEVMGPVQPIENPVLPSASKVADQEITAADIGDSTAGADVIETITRKAEPVKNPNQCVNYAGAGTDVGKSAGAISVSWSTCNTEVIGMDYVITNSHCLEGVRGKARAVFGLGQGQAKRAFECEQVAARNPKDKLDYAIIKCPGVGKHFPPVEIAGRTPKPGESIRIATHNFTESGRIKKLTNSGKILPRGSAPGESMATSAYGEPGNSGSGIYDKDGKWIGLLWGGIHDRGGRPTFFTPAHKIVADLERRYPEVAKQLMADNATLLACQTRSVEREVAQTESDPKSKTGIH